MSRIGFHNNNAVQRCRWLMPTFSLCTLRLGSCSQWGCSCCVYDFASGEFADRDEEAMVSLLVARLRTGNDMWRYRSTRLDTWRLSN